MPYLYRFPSGVFVLPLLACAGCAVYVPSTPSTPLVSQGQVEVRLGGRVLAQPALEAGAAWAPTAHLLVNADASLLESTNSTTTNGATTTFQTYHRQASVGLGYYRAPTTPEGWYLAALGGVGFAAVAQQSYDVWVIFPFPTGLYQGSYWLSYAQGYAATPLSRWLRGGFSLRGSVASYQSFSYEGQDFTPPTRVFVEPSGFLRFGTRAFQGQLSVGLTQAVSNAAGDPHRRYFNPSSIMVGGGVVLRPDLLRPRRK